MRSQPCAQRGSLLIIALILVVVTMGLCGSYLVVAHAVSHRVAESAEAKRALEAAEAGIDHARVGLIAFVDPDADRPASAWEPLLSTNGGWLPFATGVETKDGSYSVRLADNDDGDGNPFEDADEVFVLESVGYGTKQGADGASHVIRCMVRLEVNDPSERFAILAGGDLRLFGSESVEGARGRVHTNMDLRIQGNVSVSKTATASGDAETTGSGYDVGEGVSSNQDIVGIQPIVPSDYRPHADRILTSDGRVLDGPSGLVLFDFGSAASTSTGKKGSGKSSAASYEGFTWTESNGWTTTASGWVPGMYYVEGSIDFAHGGTAENPWQVTLVAEGSISMTGSPNLEPYFNGQEVFVAGQDVYARGSGSSATIEGIIMAHEQVNLSGNLALRGRVLAESAENTEGSVVDNDKNPYLCTIGGGVAIQYDGRWTRSLVPDFRLPIRSWQQELRTNLSSEPPTGG